MTHTPGSRLREAALWTGAGLGLLSLVAGVAVTFFGFTFLIFRSGSMGPEIPTGSLALARTTPAADLEVGDVVSVVAANGERITHRLVSSTVRGDEASLILQGDANGTPDAEIYQVTQAERSLASVPYAGYAVSVLLSPAGLVAVGCLSGMLFLLGGSRPQEPRSPSGPSSPYNRVNDAGRHRGAKRADRRLVTATVTTAGTTGAVMSAAAAAALVAGLGFSGTLAAFTDQATVTSAADGFTAATIATPAVPTARRQVNNVTLTWSPETSVGSTKVTRYEVLRYTQPTGGTATVACTTTAPTLTCTDTSPSGLTAYYSVRARIGSSWTNESARSSFLIDLTGPSIVHIAPPSPGPTTYEKRSDLQKAIKEACKDAGFKEEDTPACGTATDAAGVSTVEYRLQRTEYVLGTIPVATCYNGSTESWSTTCTYRAATVIQLTEGDSTKVSWQIPNKAKDAYDKSAYTYQLTIRATDALGNISTSSVTFTNLED